MPGASRQAPSPRRRRRPRRRRHAPPALPPVPRRPTRSRRPMHLPSDRPPRPMHGPTRQRRWPSPARGRPLADAVHARRAGQDQTQYTRGPEIAEMPHEEIRGKTLQDNALANGQDGRLRFITDNCMPCRIRHRKWGGSPKNFVVVPHRKSPPLVDWAISPATPATPATGGCRPARGSSATPATPAEPKKRAARRTKRRPSGASPGRAPAPRQRRFAIANVPDAAKAAEKACKRRSRSQARPATAHAAPVVAPDGPGPPLARGPRSSVAAA